MFNTSAVCKPETHAFQKSTMPMVQLSKLGRKKVILWFHQSDSVSFEVNCSR